jgi:hypothetical protein
MTASLQVSPNGKLPARGEAAHAERVSPIWEIETKLAILVSAVVSLNINGYATARRGCRTENVLFPRRSPDADASPPTCILNFEKNRVRRLTRGGYRHGAPRPDGFHAAQTPGIPRLLASRLKRAGVVGAPPRELERRFGGSIILSLLTGVEGCPVGSENGWRRAGR